MNTKALEKFCPQARVELIDAVHLRCVRYALDDAGRAAHPADADVVAGAVLTPAEKAQRTALFERIEHLDEERDGKGYATFCEQQAYSWFNRFAAIRYMELHGYLSNNVRMLSANNGAFEPECLRMASELDLPGLELAEVLDLITAGDDEALFRRILVAQMNELADCLPTVFGHVDDADALTLPDNLLARGEHDVLFHMVEDIPEEAWDAVEVLGWMYQFYNSQLKDAFFKSKRKAAVEDLAPATQLFTPDWIVRYMVENSLGRLWMLNNPGSRLREDMAYYIEPDAEHEDFIRIEGPEDITFCDPACGSGHILVYAFELLFKMYAERGYRERDIPHLILTKNLSGMEIDERAAQIASLALAMCAREHDRRFFTRGVTADICVLGSVDIDVDALDPASALRQRPKLIEALAHLDEIGSLLNPTPEDLGALKGELMRGLSGDLFVSHTQVGIERAASYCEALSRTFDVVVANPPYMGSSSFNPFMSKWMKGNYPDSCKDLCTAFIERGYNLAEKRGYAAMVTMQSWMFLGSFEKMRNDLIDNKSIVTMAHLGPRAFDAIGGEVVSVTADVLYNGRSDAKGSYFRLVDVIGSDPKRQALAEAIQNPDCGWFYRADASTFHDIPGSPIAYWASEAMLSAFANFTPLSSVADAKQGLATGNNKRFVRLWWENPLSHSAFGATSRERAISSGARWFPLAKGGEYRKWYGNLLHMVDWFEDGKAMKDGILKKYPYLSTPDFVVKNQQYYFREGITWSAVSSSFIHLRYLPQGCIFDHSGDCVFSDCIDLESAQALLNSSVGAAFLSILAPTLSFDVGPIGKVPFKKTDENAREAINAIVKQLRVLSRTDWDTQETSWGFKRNSLL